MLLSGGRAERAVLYGVGGGSVEKSKKTLWVGAGVVVVVVRGYDSLTKTA